MNIIGALAGLLVMISLCAIILAMTFRVTHWIRLRLAASTEISWCFLVATWSFSTAVILLLIGYSAVTVLTW